MRERDGRCFSAVFSVKDARVTVPGEATRSTCVTHHAEAEKSGRRVVTTNVDFERFTRWRNDATLSGPIVGGIDRIRQKAERERASVVNQSPSKSTRRRRINTLHRAHVSRLVQRRRGSNGRISFSHSDGSLITRSLTFSRSILCTTSVRGENGSLPEIQR